MILFFDTVTTGKADFRAPANAEWQPNLVQLAAVLTDEDLQIRHRFSAIIRPEKWTIPEEASAIHGITTEVAASSGILLSDALSHFSTLCAPAKRRVAHNLTFDDLIIEIAWERLGDKWAELETGIPGFCTMHAMTDICQLPGPYGFKWPKLSEAYQHATGKPMEGAHDAMADVLGCIEVYRWLMARKSEGVPA